MQKKENNRKLKFNYDFNNSLPSREIIDSNQEDVFSPREILYVKDINLEEKGLFLAVCYLEQNNEEYSINDLSNLANDSTNEEIEKMLSNLIEKGYLKRGDL